MLGERKLRIAAVVRDTGLHRNTLTLLYRETFTRIDVETLDKLCECFGCRVEDLFEWSPDSEPQKTSRT